MKAVQISTYGGSDVLTTNKNAPKPTLKNGQILIAVHAASINPFDWKVRAGYMQKMAPLTFPATMGGDFAGEVMEIGEGVTGCAKGDEVFGSAIVLNGGSGAFAELAAVNVLNSAKKPRSISYVEAAALPLVGSSAVQALENHAKVQPGQKVLIHGGAGGIGHVAIQIAKADGAYVATTVSGKDADFVKQLGADEVIDYKTQQFEKLLHDYDVVYDTVGGETLEKSFGVLKSGGVLVTMAAIPDQEKAKQIGITAIGQGTKTNSDHLKRVAELVDSGKVKVHVDKIYPLEHVREAFDYQEKSHPRGKVVLQIKE